MLLKEISLEDLKAEVSRREARDAGQPERPGPSTPFPSGTLCRHKTGGPVGVFTVGTSPGGLSGFSWWDAARREYVQASCVPEELEPVDKMEPVSAATVAINLTTLRTRVIARVIERLGHVESAETVERAFNTITQRRPLIDWIVSGQAAELIKAIIDLIQLFK